jgi:V/A-type H+/Na+-transporting ATPase subunit I
MRWREALAPVPMSRVAVVARTEDLRAALVRLADRGAVEFDRIVPTADEPLTEAARGLQQLATGGPVPARLSVPPPDVAAAVRAGRADLLAGEVELSDTMAQAVERDGLAGLLGWAPTAAVSALAGRLAIEGAAVVPLPRPAGVEPPTAGASGHTRRAFAPLVDTYGTIPYVDVDPTIMAGLAYAVMFGAMFGDVGHGALLVLGAVLVRLGRFRRLAKLRPHWIFVAAVGLSSMLFGFAYGECFGPTGLVPPGLVAPMEQPVALLVAGIALGAVLLAGAYALALVNRVREGGWALALYAPAGVAGALVFTAAGLGFAAVYWQLGWLGLAAGLLAVAGLGLAFVGLYATGGRGGAGALQAAVEVFDLVIQLGANVVSFARLAAFGLTHAVLSWVVWTATVALWQAGPAAAVGAVLVFGVGNALTFGLEALVAGIQALRLEYYELFSRVFQREGRPFKPWHVPTDPTNDPQEASCPSGSSPSRPSSLASPAL